MKVIKRDGTRVDYDSQKIYNAICKAVDAAPPKDKITDTDVSELVDTIDKECKAADHVLGVEEIQDMVVDNMAKSGYYGLMRLYSEYRYKRAMLRRTNTTDESILTLLQGNNRDLAEENSNKSTVLVSTQRDYIAGEVNRDITRRLMLPEKITKAHDEGAIHFHDTDYFIQPSINCCLVNIGDMLDNGTVMNGKMIESPHTFQVACTVLSQICASVASSQYGLKYLPY